MKKKPTAEQNILGVFETLIQQIASRIVEEYHPHKIILFGSCAWGEPREFSDIDLFIIMDSNVTRPDVRAMQVKKLSRHLEISMDLIVYTPEEVAISLKKRNPFIQDILSDGRVMYERQPEL